MLLLMFLVNLLPHVDHIIALGNGTVLEQGTLKELNSKRGYVHSFCLEHAKDNNTNDPAGEPPAGKYLLGKEARQYPRSWAAFW
jgi:hypothetical protein